MEKFLDFLLLLVPYAVTLIIGGIISWVFYYLKKRDIFGGYIGGVVIAFLGALLGGFGLDFLVEPIRIVLEVLVYNQMKVNFIGGFLGAFLALYIMCKLNHDKVRKKF